MRQCHRLIDLYRKDIVRVLMVSKACIVGIYQRKLEYMAHSGMELVVAVPPSWRDERGETMLERVYTQGYDLHVTPIRFNGNFHAHYYPELPKLIQRFQPDLVHIDEEPYNLATWHALSAAQQARARTLFFSWQNIARRYPPPFRWGEAWVCRHVQGAIVGTESAGEVWRSKGYHGAMAVIPQFGTDEQLFTPSAVRPARSFTVGFVGRLVPEKGVDQLLTALHGLQADWQLEVVGGGTQQAELLQLAHQLGISQRVRFTRQLPSLEMPNTYRRFDVLVLPSLTRPNWKEQFGRVLIEAMASGVPVIGSDSGAIPNVIGEAGLIFPENQPSALRDALQRLHDHSILYATLRQAGRARVLSHFTHAQIAQQTVAFYEQITG